MSHAAVPQPERRLMHEIAGDGRERHVMRRRADYKQGDQGYYECDCGAQSDRFGNLIRDKNRPWWRAKK